ncbi:MAG: SDR family oxidoreductase [Verrucomicrobiota bacterium]
MSLVVVTGGSGGLGSAGAENFRMAGYEVAALSSSDLDVTDEISVREWFADRAVDLLVCCAGATHDAPLARLSSEKWRETWDVNYEGAVRCAEAALSGMRNRETGHIIFVSSFSALHPPGGQAAYAAAKAALLGWMADHATALGNHNIRINTILPGFMETRMTATVSASRRAEVLANHALGRLNTPAAAAAFIRFLHENLPHTSGQVFPLDSRPFRI